MRRGRSISSPFVSLSMTDCSFSLPPLFPSSLSPSFPPSPSHTAASSSHSIYVGKDQETGLCKGFGFVSFEDRSDAEAAMAKVHGLPYDHLILQVQWSVPKGDKEDRPRRD